MIYGALGLLGIAFDEALLGYDVKWPLWFLGSVALMVLGFWFRMRLTPIPDLMLRTAVMPARVKARPWLTVIQGGKGRQWG